MDEIFDGGWIVMGIGEEDYVVLAGWKKCWDGGFSRSRNDC